MQQAARIAPADHTDQQQPSIRLFPRPADHKGSIPPSFDELKDCLRMVTHMMREVKVNEQILDDDKYALLFSVEEVNRLVLEGMPFRDAYKQVGLNIEAGKFVPVKKVHHTHEGSIGNLCNDQISALMQNIMDGFAFNRVNEAEQQLLS